MLGAAMTKQKIHDRMSSDLPINSVVAPAVVDDPLEKGAKLQMMMSLRDDPLGRLYVRDQLRSEDEKTRDKAQGRNTGEARYRAGRQYQDLLESAELGGIKGMDISKDPVDGGSIPEVLTERQRSAMHELSRTARVLGMQGEALLRDILGGRMAIEQAADARGFKSKDGRAYVGRRFRECLETLAVHFKLVDPRKFG